MLSAVLCACSASSQRSTASDAGADAGRASCSPSKARCDLLSEQRPERLSEHVAAYDAERNELVVFGGTDSTPSMCELGGATRYLPNTWIFDDACGKWSRVLGDSPMPVGRAMAAIGGGNLWLFGGRFRDASQSSGPYSVYADLSRFDLATKRWHAVEVSGDAPAARASGALIWDAKRKLLWLFGGNASTDGASYQPLSDVWSFDPKSARWNEEQPNGTGPAARLAHAALYDAERDAFVIYGGADASAFNADARYFGDLWALSLADLSWQRLHPGGDAAPDERFWAQLVYEPKRGSYLLFGGHDDQALGNRNDTWRFDPEAREWQLLSEGDRFNRDANGTCMFPPDYATIDPASPERRSAHTLAWSESCGHALLFAGKTDCGAIDDVWSFDGERWSVRNQAREGEVCLRASQDAAQCTDLCTLPNGS